MSIYHLEAQIIGRSEGRNAVACAAYRAGEKLYCDETQEYKNFDRKQHITYKAIMLPANAPKEYADRATLWNAVQKIEKNKNAQLCRELNIALPVEFDQKKQITVLNEFLQPLVDRGMIADMAIHDIKGNPHAHIMLTMRAMDEQGKWLPKKVKKYILDENGNKIPELDKKGIQKKEKNGKKIWKYETVSTTDWDNTDLINDMRASWANVCNKYLTPDKHIDHRSHKARGLEILPTVHIGVAAAALERKGIRTERGNKNRRIKEYNKYVSKMQTELNAAAKQIMEKAEQVRKEQTEIARRYLEQITAVNREQQAVGQEQQDTYRTISSAAAAVQQRAASIRAAIAGARAIVQPILERGASPAQSARAEAGGNAERADSQRDPGSAAFRGNGAGAAGTAGADRQGEQAVKPDLAEQIEELCKKQSDYKRDYIRGRYRVYNKLLSAEEHQQKLYRNQLAVNEKLIQGARLIADILDQKADELNKKISEEIIRKQEPAENEIKRLKAALEKDTRDWKKYEAGVSIFDKLLGNYAKNKQKRAETLSKIEADIAAKQKEKIAIEFEYNREIQEFRNLTDSADRLRVQIPAGLRDNIKSAKARHDRYLADIQRATARYPELKSSDKLRDISQQWQLLWVQNNIDKAISRKVQANPQYQERAAAKAAQLEQAKRAKAAAQRAAASKPNRSRSRGRSRDDDYSR